MNNPMGSVISNNPPCKDGNARFTTVLENTGLKTFKPRKMTISSTLLIR